jgi:large subunit ribosomal protein L6
MSRIGKHPVDVPKGVTIALAGRTITAKGKLGELKLDLSDQVDATVEDGKITVVPRSETKQARTMWGTTRALLNNMVHGVAVGFTRRLEINGVGYRAAVQGSDLTLQLGYSHDIKYKIPKGITIVAEKPTTLVVSGADRQRVGQVAAEIRGYRGPEPYKGKGIKYEDETIVRKEGKKK